MLVSGGVIPKVPTMVFISVIFSMTFRIGRFSVMMLTSFMLVVSGRGSDASVHDGRFFHMGYTVYTFFIWCWLCGMMLGTFSSYTQSYPHPIRLGSVLHTFLLCLSKVLEDATNNNSQITLWTKNILHMFSHFGSLCKIGRGTFESFPQSFVHETLHTGWERSDLSWLGGGFNFLLFSPLVGEDFKFDRYFFKRVGSTTNQMTIDWCASFFGWISAQSFPLFLRFSASLCVKFFPQLGVRDISHERVSYIHLKRIETSNDCSKNWEDVNIFR